MSEIRCGNCGNVYSMDEAGDRIQPCPSCGSREMVKGL